MKTYKNNFKRNRYRTNGDRYFRRNGNDRKLNSDFSNGLSFNRKHSGRNNQNASKLVEKYSKLAREALSGGDKILYENYLQHSDHFLRILIEQKNNSDGIDNGLNKKLSTDDSKTKEKQPEVKEDDLKKQSIND